jgi:hypothetical protein
MRHAYANADTNSHAYTDSNAHRHALSDANVPTGRTDNNTLRLE